MTKSPTEPTLSELLSSALSYVEAKDNVLFELVNIGDYIPSLPSSGLEKKGSKGRIGKNFIDPSSITKDNINAVRARRNTTGEGSKIKEKDVLISKQSQLESQIDIKIKLIEEKMKKKEALERQLTEIKNRFRIGSRISIPQISDDFQKDLDVYSNDVQYWKEKYDSIHKQYEEMKNVLAKKGAITRVSGNMVRAIPAPKYIPQSTIPED